MPLALLSLFAGAFAIGTSEFVIAGILPSVSTDLGISIPTAGLLVSLYALGVAIGGPVLAAFTGRLPRKMLVVVYLSVFIAGNMACALAPGFQLLLVARLVASLIHGAFFGAAMVTATTLVDENRRGFAISLILAGLTVSNVVGVPFGTAIGTAFGWRVTFWAVAALGVVSLATVTLLVPADGAHEGTRSSFLAELKVLTRERVYSTLLIILAQTVGQFALFTYISPILTDIAGVPLDVVPWLLLVFGVGSTIGVLIGGRLADWRLLASLNGILAAQLIVHLLMVPFVGNAWIFTLLVLLWGGTTFAFGAPVQTRILASTRDSPLLAASLVPSAFNVSIAAGAWLGGALIDGGQSYAVLPWIGVVATAVALAFAGWQWTRERPS